MKLLKIRNQYRLYNNRLADDLIRLNEGVMLIDNITKEDFDLIMLRIKNQPLCYCIVEQLRKNRNNIV